MRAAVSLIEGTPLLYAKLIQNKTTIKVLAVKHKFFNSLNNKTMNTELTYLLEELDNWDENKPIQVKDLKRMIIKSFKKADEHQQQIEDSMSEIGHDM